MSTDANRPSPDNDQPGTEDPTGPTGPTGPTQAMVWPVNVTAREAPGVLDQRTLPPA